MQTCSPVHGGPLLFLRAESFVIFCVFSFCAFTLSPVPVWETFLLFWAPDLSFFGYLLGSRVGAFCYNCLHNYVGPALLAAVPVLETWLSSDGFSLSQPMLSSNPWLFVSFLWAAHVGFDRMLGFGYTHLGWLEKWVQKDR